MSRSHFATELGRVAATRRCSTTDLLIDFALSAVPPVTYLAVCPNSESVALAALRAAQRHAFPLFFAATLNQIDRADGYTRWTPRSFSKWVLERLEVMTDAPPVIIGLDHGGPWKKDQDFTARIDLAAAIAEVEASIAACLQAGYRLLHVDATVDPGWATGVPVDVIVSRTVRLIQFAENVRADLNLDPIAYEVGTEEVSGGLTTTERFSQFVSGLRTALAEAGLSGCWPRFFVGDVGTDLGTSHFDEQLAVSLASIVRPFGSMLKGHYTDFVDFPDRYPPAGMGGANVGPEYSAVEYDAIMELAAIEAKLGKSSGIEEALLRAVADTGRWRKWLTVDEQDSSLDDLPAERRSWLVATGSRYVWEDDQVRAAREVLMDNVAEQIEGTEFVIGRICARIERYAEAFGLINVQERLVRYLRDSV